jgi:hypothetical protein
MSYLLYCIFRNSVCTSLNEARNHKNQKKEVHAGIGCQPVFILSKDGLSAAVSKIAFSDMASDIPNILIYKTVVESFHHDLTVIPMRYGCIFDEEYQIVNFLGKRAKQYETLLKELDGNVELGIRIFFEMNQQEEIHATNDILNSSTCWRTYLAARKEHYVQEEIFNKEIKLIIERCCNAFKGLFIKYRVESQTYKNLQLISLYFLVSRKCTESFRKVFWHISSDKSVKFLLSGPWPPYNFVLPTSTQDKDSSFCIV